VSIPLFNESGWLKRSTVKATHEDLLAEDWDANLQICDRVSEEGEQGYVQLSCLVREYGLTFPFQRKECRSILDQEVNASESKRTALRVGGEFTGSVR
jgi:hypothetical protein